MVFSADGEAAETDTAVYAWILKHHRLDAQLIHKDLGLPVSEIESSLERLYAAGMVASTDNDTTFGFAVDPDLAIAKLTGPIEAHVREEQQRILAIHRELERFTSYYKEQSSASHALGILTSLGEVRQALNHEAARCNEEMLSCQPGGSSRNPSAMSEAIQRDRALLERGVSIRTLYHHTARFNGPSLAYAATASPMGAQYRTLHELFGRVIIFDRRIAFIPVQDQSWGAVTLREPSTVAYLCDVFEEAWERGTPFADAASQGLEAVSREIHETIIRLLAAGHKDATIARRLGMSLRTIRRHIADIMEQLDAASRFQAGVAAAARGLVKAPAVSQSDLAEGNAAS